RGGQSGRGDAPGPAGGDRDRRTRGEIDVRELGEARTPPPAPGEIPFETGLFREVQASLAVGVEPVVGRRGTVVDLHFRKLPEKLVRAPLGHIPSPTPVGVRGEGDCPPKRSRTAQREAGWPERTRSRACR